MTILKILLSFFLGIHFELPVPLMPLKPVGLQNCGNSCYMNSVLQCLFNLDQLSTFLISNVKYFKSNSIAKQLANLSAKFNMGKITNSKAEKLVLSSSDQNLKKFYFGVGRAISGETYKQEDAQECLQLFLSSLKEDLVAENTVNSKAISRIKNRLSKTFEVKLNSSIKPVFLENETAQVREEKENLLSLEITPDTCTLNDCLNSFFDPEVIDENGDDKFFWQATGKYETVVKQFSLKELPRNLIIQLKRFNWNKTTQKVEKSFKALSFPLDNLNMGKHLEQSEDATYELTGVIVHKGFTASGGHYVSYVKMNNTDPKKSKWYLCDDSNIKEVSSNEISKLSTFGVLDRYSTPYVLFYKRKQ